MYLDVAGRTNTHPYMGATLGDSPKNAQVKWGGVWEAWARGVMHGDI